MISNLKILLSGIAVILSLYSYAQDAEYRVTIDADPLIKQINGRDLPGEAQVRVVLTGKRGEVIGGKLANAVIPSILIDEEDDIGKVIGVEITLNGLDWTKSVKVRNVKVRKTTGEDSKTYNFPCGCPLTQGNQSVYMDAGGALDFMADADAIRAEEMEMFEMEGEFESGDVGGSGFTISKRNTGNPEPRKVGRARVEKSGQMVCTTQNYNASASFDLNFLTNPTQNAIYPGALIYAEDLASGAYTNIKSGRDRAPLIISTSSAVLGSPLLEVDNPSLATIRGAMNDILINQERGDLEVQANFEIFEVSSKEELSIALGGHFSNASIEVNASFNYDASSGKSLKVVKFAQIYYTMDVDPPGSPEDVFTNPKDAMEVMNSGKTPLYVSSVTFGRIAYFFMETSMSSQNIQAHLDAEKSGAMTIRGEADLATSMEREQTNIKALIIGGDGAGGITAVNGYEGFMQMLETGGTLSRQSLGVPVSYTMRFLADNSIARVNLATNYTKRTCEKVNNPIQKARVVLNSVTATSSYKFYGKVQAYLMKGQNDPYPVTILSENLYSENSPSPMQANQPLALDITSRAFSFDVRKLDKYVIAVSFTAHEEDPNVFYTSGSGVEIKQYPLKQILNLGSGGIPTEKSIRVPVDEFTYTLNFKIQKD